MRRTYGVLLAGALTVGIPVLTAAPAAAETIAACDADPNPPSWFYPTLADAADVPGDGVPTEWGDSRAMAKIVCRESDFNPGAQNGSYYGLGQMSRTNVEAAGVSWRCYWEGGCTKLRRYYQALAALRYAKSRYGHPSDGWQHIKTHGWW